MNQASSTLGIPIGPLVDLLTYDRIFVNAATALPDEDHRQLFGVGWTGLGYRALAASTHIDAFRTTFEHEPSASSLERFEQDRHFFGFVTNASAAAENFLYATYAASLGLAGAAPTDQGLKARRADMLNAIKAAPATVVLGRTIESKLGEAPAQALFTMRDVVLHRGRLARNHYVGGGYDGRVTIASNPKALPVDWLNTFVLSPQCMDPWAAWLSAFVADAATLLLQALPAPQTIPAGAS